MPGVLMVEAMAQAGAVAVLSEESNRGKLALFAGIDDVRFKRIVRAGRQLELVCDLERLRGPIGRGKATATVDGELAVRGTLTFALTRLPAMIASVAANGVPVGITGVGVYVPERVLTNDGPRAHGRHVGRVDRRADRDQGAAHRLPTTRLRATSRFPPPARRSSGRARPRRSWTSSSSRRRRRTCSSPRPPRSRRDGLGADRAAAYDLLAACTGFVYGLAQAYGAVSAARPRRRRSWSARRRSRRS